MTTTAAKPAPFYKAACRWTIGLTAADGLINAIRVPGGAALFAEVGDPVFARPIDCGEGLRQWLLVHGATGAIIRATEACVVRCLRSERDADGRPVEGGRWPQAVVDAGTLFDPIDR
jgi:hypothetical protein